MSHEINLKIDQILSLIKEYKLERQGVFTVKEAATFMKISTSKLYKLTCLKQIVCYKPENKLILFKRSDLEEYMFRNKQDTQL